MKKEDKIVITEWYYKHGDSKFPKNMVQKDKQLSEVIMGYYHDVLKLENVELWVHDFNIIATSKKFYGAFFEEDLNHSENK